MDEWRTNENRPNEQKENFVNREHLWWKKFAFLCQVIVIAVAVADNDEDVAIVAVVFEHQ